MPARYFYERAYWALRRALAAPQKPAVVDTVPVRGLKSSNPTPPKADPLNPGQLPSKPPVTGGGGWMRPARCIRIRSPAHSRLREGRG